MKSAESERDPRNLTEEQYIQHLEWMNEQLRRERDYIERSLGILHLNRKVKSTPIIAPWKRAVFKALVRLMRIGAS